jgi:glutathione S-transferase
MEGAHVTEIKLVGAYASPYSRKMRAVLRYRRIPFRWILRGSADDVDVPSVPVALIPVLVLPGPEGDAAMIDSTFQVRRLETLVTERAVVPPDPALAFLDALVEDYADEWLTKAMFHYRWAFAPDAAKASRVIPCDQQLELPEDQLARGGDAFAARQIGRLAVVGSNPTTAPVIEASYRRLLAVLDAQLRQQPFVFGARPSAGDFGLFGQLSQLAAFDPTSAAIAAETAPRVIAWVNRVDDLSWLAVDEAGWHDRAAARASIRPLLAEIGRVYAPFLVANAAALAARAEQVECRIDGARWVQTPFPYQGKCLRWLREQHAVLAGADRAFADDVLAGTGCDALFAG